MKKSRGEVEISSAEEILATMGFRKSAPESTKRAFLRHLVSQANSESALSKNTQLKNEKVKNEEHNQLSFFDIKKLA